MQKRFALAGLLFLGIGLAPLLGRSADGHDCENVRCLLQQDGELSRQFDSHMPLFVKRSSSNPLSEAVPEFKRDAKFSHMLDVLTENTQHMRRAAPAAPNCAVVGNSQNLRGSSYGTFIDRHGFVFRMNSAPIEGYAQDVGTRTTHHVFSHFYAGNDRVNGEIHIRPYSPETFNVLIPLHSDPSIPFNSTYKNYAAFAPFFAHLAEALSSDPNASLPPLTRDDMTQVQNVSNLVVFTPDFLWYVNGVWFDPQNKGAKDIASTGFLSIILALHLCDKIDLFGFGATKDGAWGHYFDASNAKPARHHTSYQEQFLDMLETKRFIKVYRGKQ